MATENICPISAIRIQVNLESMLTYFLVQDCSYAYLINLPLTNFACCCGAPIRTELTATIPNSINPIELWRQLFSAILLYSFLLQFFLLKPLRFLLGQQTIAFKKYLMYSWLIMKKLWNIEPLVGTLLARRAMRLIFQLHTTSNCKTYSNRSLASKNHSRTKRKILVLNRT